MPSVVFARFAVRLCAEVCYICVCVLRVYLCVRGHVTMIACQSKVFATERDRGAKLKGTFVSS